MYLNGQQTTRPSITVSLIIIGSSKVLLLSVILVVLLIILTKLNIIIVSINVLLLVIDKSELKSQYYRLPGNPSLLHDLIVFSIHCSSIQVDKCYTKRKVWPLARTFIQFSGCWLFLPVCIIMSFDFPFVRLFGVR